ncbi:protein Peter pan [Daktulosphaira vitifoliae]|uniref:protein Peter pan n=1 Tax=Daktulosphaira vitifoliae TaxID=58002 RepID=UPI0021A98F5E|nr:protein Peter pan [Daktulosphaira vitifoliae]XP_050541281.1 protein Peter pan [Daktulosphaira vitifoliae]XP_050541282.1 protein Peter pan [Daktulosphaira vitifoliae]
MGSKRKSTVKKNKRLKKFKKKVYEEPEDLKRAPHSFVIHRGQIGKSLLQLVKDFRKVMEPFTASSLQVYKKNTIKDFVSLAGPLHVSHLVVFTSSDTGINFRVARLPQGPTMTFKLHNYVLSKDVVSSLHKQMVNPKLFSNAPLIVMNNFTGEGLHINLMSTMFQNMFPTINITKVNLNDIRRCVLMNYNPDTKLIEFRHYAIKTVPVGLSKGVKKIVQSKVPNLSNYNDIDEYLLKPELLSESEVEDNKLSTVVIPQKLVSRGNIVGTQSSIRLSELGPRLTLQLIKVEDGLMNGDVMFHEYIKKDDKN